MKLIYRQHAIQRMFERGISADEVRVALGNGKVVENYPDDMPYPSLLWVGYADMRPLHIVCADNFEAGERIIITVYEPDPKQWEPDFLSRRRNS